jgi:peptidoglycan/LPS O-acetylase OafA/YrhL
MDLAQKNRTNMARLWELDGLRGWAALSVVLFHIFWETFGRVEPGFRNVFTGFFFHGRLAVCIFFVLSGEALSAGYFADKGIRSVVRLAVKRYFRLTIPILASCLIVYALMTAGLVANHQAATIVDRNDWLGDFLQFDANLKIMLRYALLDVYDVVNPSSAYNPFLWTMKIELLGSIIVFLVLFIEPYLKWPELTLGLAILLLFAARSFICCFLVGVLYAKARQGGLFMILRERKWPTFVSWTFIPLIALGDGLLQISDMKNDDRTPILISIVLLWLIFSNKVFAGFFASGPSRLLGRLSFSLYLMQFPVLISLTSLLIVWAQNSGNLSTVVIWGIAIISAVACLLAAVLFDPIEQGTKIFADVVSRKLLK